MTKIKNPKRKAHAARRENVVFLAIVILIVSASVASADLITPGIADFSSQHSYVAPGRYAINTVNGSGLTGDGSAGSTHASTEGLYWTSATIIPQHITFDLGGLYDVDLMRIWNYNNAGDTFRGIADMTVSVGTSLATLASQGTFSLAQAPGTPGYTGEDHAVSFATVRYIRFDATSTHGGTLPSLSEVRFEGTQYGGPLFTPFIGSVSSENVLGIPRDADTTINGSGMTDVNANGIVGDNGDTHSNATTNGLWWTPVGNLGPGTDYDPEITYDLGGLYDVNVMRVWNDNSFCCTHLGAREVEVFAGATLASMTSRGTLTFAQAPGVPAYSGEDFIVNYSGVRHITFDILNNHDTPVSALLNGEGPGNGGTDGRFLTGLAEVRFNCSVYSAVGTLITPTVHAVSSENVVGIDRDADYSSDGSGMTGTGANGSVHANGENGIAWTTVGSLGPGTDYAPFITYDLGARYDVKLLRIWNYNSSLNLGPATITIIGADDVDVYTSNDGVSFNLAGSVNFALAPGANGYPGEDIPVDFLGARYVRFDIKTNHDGAVFDGTGTQPGVIDARSLTGLSEVRFMGTIPVGTVVRFR
jgi:hypothetical protein